MIAVALLAALAAQAPASRFVSELPVMPGLWESGSGYAYQLAPDARLAETRLVGRNPVAEVLTFYAGALAGAGWRRERAPYAFHRGHERLVIHLAPHRAAGSVQTEALFVVTPDGAAAAPAPAPHPKRHAR